MKISRSSTRNPVEHDGNVVEPIPLLFYVDERRILTKERFLAKHRHPVLLSRPDDAAPSELAFVTHALDDDASPLERASGLVLSPELVVRVVAKRPEAPFPDRIGLGRARNTDVFIRRSEVSKYHAYFVTREQALMLVDADSRNGTFIDGARIPPRKESVIRDRTIVAFGKHAFRFHTPDGFCNALTDLAFGKQRAP